MRVEHPNWEYRAQLSLERSRQRREDWAQERSQRRWRRIKGLGRWLLAFLIVAALYALLFA